MKPSLKLMVILVVLALIADILVRISDLKPVVVNGTISGVPVISSWIDVVLAVLFGIPVAMEFYSRFLCDPLLKLF